MKRGFITDLTPMVYAPTSSISIHMDDVKQVLWALVMKKNAVKQADFAGRNQIFIV